MTQTSKQDDFEESLVRQVIEENPPEEQGVRPEWEQHAGWHRKEYVGLRGAEHKQSDANLGNASVEPTTDAEKNAVTFMGNKLWVFSCATVIALLVLLRIRNSRHKTRKQ